MGQVRKGKKQLKVTSSDESGTDPDSDLSDDELTRRSLSFLRTTRSGYSSG